MDDEWKEKRKEKLSRLDSTHPLEGKLKCSWGLVKP